jgi:hypothetical protein
MAGRRGPDPRPLLDELETASLELAAAREAVGAANERLLQAERRFDTAVGRARRALVGPPEFRPKR